MNVYVIIGLVILAGLLFYGLFVEERRHLKRKGKLRTQRPAWMEDDDDVVELDLSIDD